VSNTVEAMLISADALPPGPRLPKSVQAMLRIWHFAEFSDRGHARYGDTFTVRIGGLPPGVLTSNREAIRRLFTGDPLLKRHGNDLLRTLVGDQSVLVLDPPEHLTRRKLVSPPFHGERVQSYAQIMEELVAQALTPLQRGEVVAIQPIAQELTLSVIMQAVFGISDAAVRSRLRRIFDALNTPLNAIALFVPALSRRARWNLLSVRAWRLKDELDAILLEQIAAARDDERLGERQDILAGMLSAKGDDGSGLSDEQLRDELITLIIAGHETTATAIAWGVELLVRNPAVMADARDGDEAYLDALVKEILRIRAPVPIGGTRQVLEPFTIGSWTIPANVPIIVDAHAVHNDPELFPEPRRFRPERFLDTSGEGYSFLTFGGGAHRCIGAALAQLEIKVVLREILSRLELAPASPKPATPVPRGPTLAPRGGARVRITGLRAVQA
jgi:cytochrome P450